MKQLLLFSLFCTCHCWSIAQKIQPAQIESLRQKEDSLKTYALRMVQGTTAENRFQADSLFTKMLVRALITKNSIYYPFDSLVSISKLYASDTSFRIFTWQVVINENIIRQHGAIQVRTPDGSLKLFPLIDKSDVTINQADTITSNRSWIGAVYYKIIETKNEGKKFYTLLGYDEHNIRSNRKIIEVMNFKNEEPSFGGRFFSFEEDTARKPKPLISRYIMEYKKDAGARLNYDEELAMVVYEHLESETNEPNKKWTYIPDGDYEGFKWKNGKWMHVNKVFTTVTPEGKEPVPSPLQDAADKLKVNPPRENQP